MATPTVKAVLFDLGGVFLDWDPRYYFARYFGSDVAGMERFLTQVCSPEWHAQQDLGRDIGEACHELAQAHPEQAELIYAWREGTEEMIKGVFDGTLEIFAQLREKESPATRFPTWSARPTSAAWGGTRSSVGSPARSYPVTST
jgi:2-haloacid dehalogenase